MQPNIITFTLLETQNRESMEKRKLWLITAFAMLSSMSLYAVTATPEPIVKTQADGTTVTLRMVGDEFAHYYTLLDGTPVRLNARGMWEKTTREIVLPDKEALRRAPSRRVAEQANAFSSYPLSGSPKSLVILVNFTDLKFQHTQEEFNKMLNEKGYMDNGAIGSARDYFEACSNGVFSPQFDCFGPFTLKEGYAYYGQNKGDNSSLHAAQMVIEACELAAKSGVDMADYDTNNDGRLDNVFIYFAGHNEAEHGGENTIWPHRSAIGGDVRVGGKLVYDYACTSELRGASGNSMCGIGTFCHEFGHVLGLPDYYDTSYSYYTVGTWDIMCSGSYNGNGRTPPSYSAGERFQLGWLKPIQLQDAGPYVLEPLETSNKAYLIAKTEHNLSWENASPSEYWLLENRQRVGWDSAASVLPGTGMLIFHIAYNAGAWGSNEPNNYIPARYDIVEANGAKGYSTAADPFPGTANVTQFTPTLHNKEIVEQPLLDIAESGEDITFTFKSNGEDKFIILPTDMPVILSSYNSTDKTEDTPASKLKIVGSHLDPASPVTISSSKKDFQLSLDSASWRTDIEVGGISNDSTLEIELFVRYAPRKQVCDIQRSTITFRQGKAVGTYIVNGISPRPTLISVPDITSLEEVTPTSFKIRWEPQTDAEEYYVTLYHMEEGTESTMESFEGFDDEATMFEAGWSANFYRTTQKAKSDGDVSMWFRQDGEQMLSPVYNLPVTKLSFWLNAPSTTDKEVGWIMLKGISEEGETVIDTIQITRGTKSEEYTVSFDEQTDIRRFIITYASFGGDGVCLDAFTTTFNQKTVYTYKGRERTIPAQDGELAYDYAIFYAYDLIPSTDYFVRLQCAENKGCQEHLSDISPPFYVRTKDGGDTESKQLTLDYDSISYDPATHVVYLPKAETSGYVGLYTPGGELVKLIAVRPTQHVVPLPDAELTRGAMYIVKYMPATKLGRKNPWIKIIYL